MVMENYVECGGLDLPTDTALQHFFFHVLRVIVMATAAFGFVRDMPCTTPHFGFAAIRQVPIDMLPYAVSMVHVSVVL